MAAVVVDASSNGVAFGADDRSLQTISGSKALLLKDPCHTTMLVVGEVNAEFRSHKSTLKALVVFLQKPVVLGALRNSGCPGRICVLQGGKWKPLNETARFILAHREAIERALLDFGGNSELRLPDVPLPGRFVQYLEVVQKLSGHAVAVQGDRFRLSQYAVPADSLCQDLCSRASAGNEIAGYALERLQERLDGDTFRAAGEAKVDLAFARLATVFTADGRRSLQDEARACGGFDYLGVSMDPVKLEHARRFLAPYKELEQRLLCVTSHWFQSELDIVGAVSLKTIFRQYCDARLLPEALPDDSEAIEHWNSLALHELAALRLMARVAAWLVGLPASEAVAERVFSWFKYIFPRGARPRWI
jgi:hypothetical protein